MVRIGGILRNIARKTGNIRLQQAVGTGMRFVHWALILASGFAWIGAAQAQTRADIERCRAITDDARRLDCYDAITLAPGTRSKYDIVPLNELINFALSYRGDLVEVSGWIRPDDDVFFLSPEEGGEESVPIDFGLLSRHERQSFLDQCGDACEATVQGRVSPVNFTTGIVADAIIVH